MQHRRKNDRFLRPSNIKRLAGGALIIAGEAFKMHPYNLDGFVFDSNFIQIAGGLILFAPTLLEIFRTVFLKGKGAQDEG